MDKSPHKPHISLFWKAQHPCAVPAYSSKLLKQLYCSQHWTHLCISLHVCLTSTDKKCITHFSFLSLTDKQALDVAQSDSRSELPWIRSSWKSVQQSPAGGRDLVSPYDNRCPCTEQRTGPACPHQHPHCADRGGSRCSSEHWIWPLRTLLMW